MLQQHTSSARASAQGSKRNSAAALGRASSSNVRPVVPSSAAGVAGAPKVAAARKVLGVKGTRAPVSVHAVIAQEKTANPMNIVFVSAEVAPW